MDNDAIYGRGIAFPPRIGEDGRLSFSVGPENIREAIQVILLTRRLERLMLPDFGGGLESFLYEPNTPATRRLIQERIAHALTRWEPRIELESVSVEEDPDDAESAVATIRYRLVATHAPDQLNVHLNLASQEGGQSGAARRAQG